jgi:hypothetical protein
VEFSTKPRCCLAEIDIIRDFYQADHIAGIAAMKTVEIIMIGIDAEASMVRGGMAGRTVALEAITGLGEFQAKSGCDFVNWD